MVKENYQNVEEKASDIDLLVYSNIIEYFILTPTESMDIKTYDFETSKEWLED